MLTPLPGGCRDLHRLLVVDDEEAVRSLLYDAFGGSYTVVTAADGYEALAELREARPAVVLLDMLMPGMDGVETLERIQAFDPTIPVIMLTANQDTGRARATLVAGAFDYVRKPFDLEGLARVIAAACAENEPQRAEPVGRVELRTLASLLVDTPVGNNGSPAR
ncbi:MAG TPA: response regulator [Methylomirabilota bacterium]|jgi:DNA-binding NtrC family response regulator